MAQTCAQNRAFQGCQLALDGLELAGGQLALQVLAQLLHGLPHLLHLHRFPLLQLLRCALPRFSHLHEGRLHGHAPGC